MNDETNELLRQLIELQKEQLELTRKNVLPLFTRIRFSMMALLALMTVMAISLGVIAIVNKPPDYTPPSPPPPAISSIRPVAAAPKADPNIDIP